LEEKDLIPEGIAYDDQERAFYVGSIHRNKIVRVPEKGGNETRLLYVFLNRPTFRERAAPVKCGSPG